MSKGDRSWWRQWVELILFLQMGKDLTKQLGGFVILERWLAFSVLKGLSLVLGKLVRDQDPLLERTLVGKDLLLLSELQIHLFHCYPAHGHLPCKRLTGGNDLAANGIVEHGQLYSNDHVDSGELRKFGKLHLAQVRPILFEFVPVQRRKISDWVWN